MFKYSELKFVNRQNLKEVLPLGKPFTVLIEPSSLCNFKCIQCFQSIKAVSSFTRNRGHLPLSRFKRAIDQLKVWPGPRLKVLKLSLYGEPLVNSDFTEMLRLAREADIAERIETTTNATLLDTKVAERMVEYQLDYARVSIYASDQERHRAVTGSGLEIRIIHENLRILQEIKKKKNSEKPFICCKMMDSYGEENERFVRLYQNVADEVTIDKPHHWIKGEGADFIKNYYQKDYTGVMTDLMMNRSGRIACPMAFTTMTVRSNGDVSPCCIDFIGDTTLGHMDESSLEAIWNSDPWIQFQKMQLENRKQENPSCARCDFYLNDYYIKDTIDGFAVTKLRRPVPPN